jgi:hypothetical protein
LMWREDCSIFAGRCFPSAAKWPETKMSSWCEVKKWEAENKRERDVYCVSHTRKTYSLENHTQTGK